MIGMQTRISEEDSDILEESDMAEVPQHKRQNSPETTTSSSTKPQEEQAKVKASEDSVNSFQEESDFDSEEELDEFSISLHDEEDDNDTASFFSSVASSVATDDQSFTSAMASSMAERTEGELESQKIAKSETKAVRWGRTGMLLVLSSFFFLLPFSLFRVARKDDKDTFTEEFQHTSEEIGQLWKRSLLSTLQSVDGLMIDIVSETSATPEGEGESQWPFVTIENFFLSSDRAFKMSTETIRSNSLLPVVDGSIRADYEDYVATNQSWIAEPYRNLRLIAENKMSNRKMQGSTMDLNGEIYEFANDLVVPASGPGPFAPTRHNHPLVESALNYNVKNNTMARDDIDACLTSSGAVVGRFLAEDEDSARLLRGASLDDSETQDDLYGTIVYPVFPEVGQSGALGEPVAFLFTVYSVSALIEGALLDHTGRVYAILENSCGQVATLELDGDEITFLGYRDEHDEAYNSHRKSFDLEGLGLEAKTISQVPLAGATATTCSLTLSLYPSREFEDEYQSGLGGTYVAISVATLFLVLLLFVLYDCMLERRNRALLQSALEARAIVSSLFPANVRDRLFETNREKAKKKKKRKKLLRKKGKKKKKKDGEIDDSRKDGVPNAIGDDGGASPSKTGEERAPTSKLSPLTVRNILDSAHPPLGETDEQKRIRRTIAHPKHRLKTFLASTHSVLEDRSEEFALNKPIADLFPHTTVLFADIVGFTAWSSERAPEDVFTLLQTIYHSFDKVAKRRGVFKVETIGDCYVAVTGLPDPQPDHAVRMTKFARECMTKMNEVTKKLELSLGPDTGDLCMRLGLNSGPVTAGVLQGEKSRFQLFGDTVNTASRMESTGEMNRVHVSKSTADLLIEAGKSYWVKPRDDMVHAKGKGNVQTYWLVSRSENFTLKANRSSDALENEFKRVAPSRTMSAFGRGEPIRGVNRTTSDSIAKVERVTDMVAQGRESNDKREERLVQWQVELFIRLLKRIVAARDEKPSASKASTSTSDGWNGIPRSSSHSISLSTHSAHGESWSQDRFSRDAPVRGPGMMLAQREPSFRKPESPIRGPGMMLPQREPSFRMPTRRPSVTTNMNASVSTMNSATDPDLIVVDEVVEIITLPKLNTKSIKALENASSLELAPEVVSQLKDYITTIAHMYRQNPFHNFEHASHVTMSANKLLNRIVTPENVDYERESNAIASDLHDYTYGITSDPLTQFAVIFSALVHDVDHTGVPNSQLSKENPDMAAVYRNQSVAEQNSVDIAWELFMDPRYKELQDCIAATHEERKRFRQLVVNSVLATDIFDPTMKSLRNKRWEKAFHRDEESKIEITDTRIEEDRNMKATIVIEHIIQASDVAHTMQHWHIYQKWNERLFDEMYSAYECGRSEKNPADGWYKGELWFFDNYVIPLAKKLEECNVFGVASDECLNYAQANRNEWSIKGEETVQEMVERYNKRKFFVAGMAKKRHPNRRQPSKRLQKTTK